MPFRFPEVASYGHGFVDYCSDLDSLYLLYSDHVTRINLNSREVQEIKLQKRGVVTSIYVDEENLAVGFRDGTMELRLRSEGYGLLRVTDTADAGGPGDKDIRGIGGSEEYLLVRAAENGLMIYTKPSMLFYKWIMLGGICVIDAFSIIGSQMYVLRDDYDIHMLDFEKHRIFEQFVMAYDYIDLEYDGQYLYTATSKAVIIYRQEIAERPQRQTIVKQYNFPSPVRGLIRINLSIWAVFDDHMVAVTTDLLGDTVGIPASQLALRLKYHYFMQDFVTTPSLVPLFDQQTSGWYDLITT